MGLLSQWSLPRPCTSQLSHPTHISYALFCFMSPWHSLSYIPHSSIALTSFLCILRMEHEFDEGRDLVFATAIHPVSPTLPGAQYTVWIERTNLNWVVPASDFQMQRMILPVYWFGIYFGKFSSVCTSSFRPPREGHTGFSQSWKVSKVSVQCGHPPHLVLCSPSIRSHPMALKYAKPIPISEPLLSCFPV